MESPIVFDTLMHVEVPEGVSDQGKEDILAMLTRYKIALPEDWEWKWTSKRGNMTKRVEKVAKDLGRVLPSNALQKLGEIAQENSLMSTTYHMKFTKDLEWKEGSFGDAGSCFWGGRVSNRMLLIQRGAYAVQFFADAEGKVGIGRSFGFELDPPVQVLFNAYGKLTPGDDSVEGRNDSHLVTVSNIVSLALKLGSYKKVNLQNTGWAAGDLFINNSSGYVIGPLKLIRHISVIDLHLEDETMTPCQNCGIFQNPDTLLDTGEDPLRKVCKNCYQSYYYECTFCHKPTKQNEAKILDGHATCKTCFGKNGRVCGRCENSFMVRKMFFRQYDKKWLCRDCLYRTSASCPDCQNIIPVDAMMDGLCPTDWGKAKEKEKERMEEELEETGRVRVR